MTPQDWISAEEARARLNIRPQTLYAYVSRGRLQVRPDPADPRRSLYRAADVDALGARKSRSRKLSEVAAGAMAWGEPALVSAITTVVGGRLFYRGRDAVALSATETLEATARLLRGGYGVALKRSERPAPPDHPDFRTRVYLALAERAAVDPPLLGRSPISVAAEAAGLLDLVADAVAGAAGAGPIHARLAQAWGVPADGPAADLIRRTLVLVADHELNASAFAARVAASTGASLAAAALAGLATLSGPRHGGASAGVRRFVEEARTHGAPEAVRRRLLDERFLPGFGHPLYPQGDPRAAALLAGCALAEPLLALQAAAREVTGLSPNIDFAMIAACDAFGLPQDAPFALFVTARCAGWIAHAVEQGQSDALIRPRARYVGPAPEAAV